MGDLWQLAIAGLCTGVGSTVGSWLANKGINQKLEKLSKDIKRRLNK